MRLVARRCHLKAGNISVVDRPFLETNEGI